MNNSDIAELEKRRQKVFKKTRICLTPNCNEIASQNCHLLGQASILSNIISEKNKFYEPVIKSLFNRDFGLLKIKERGIKEGFAFNGFCQSCDDRLFSNIEKKEIDFKDQFSIGLYSYKAICCELRKKEMHKEDMEVLLQFHKEKWPEKSHKIDFEGVNLSVRDLEFYKSELELELWSNCSNYKHFYLELPLQKVCFTSSLTIEDPNNKDTWDELEKGQTNYNIFPHSFITYFPYEKKSHFIASFHKEKPCNWTVELINDLQQNQEKTISDILTYRIEHWAMSPVLFDSFENGKIKQFVAESDAEYNNYSFNISSNFNLFKK